MTVAIQAANISLAEKAVLEAMTTTTGTQTTLPARARSTQRV